MNQITLPLTDGGFHDLARAPRLETDRLVLRAPVASDRAPWMAFLTSERGRWHGGGPTEGEGRAFRIFAALLGHWAIHGFGPFVAELKDGGRPVASVGAFFPPDWPEREVGWAIWDEADEGKGYATEAAIAVLAHYRDAFGWMRLVSYIAPDNAPSIALAERLGTWRDADAPGIHPDTLVFVHDAPQAGAA
jgi:RimJ/RimL family protein N-acetyltransferase